MISNASKHIDGSSLEKKQKEYEFSLVQLVSNQSAYLSNQSAYLKELSAEKRKYAEAYQSALSRNDHKEIWERGYQGCLGRLILKELAIIEKYRPCLRQIRKELYDLFLSYPNFYRSYDEQLTFHKKVLIFLGFHSNEKCGGFRKGVVLPSLRKLCNGLLTDAINSNGMPDEEEVSYFLKKLMEGLNIMMLQGDQQGLETLLQDCFLYFPPKQKPLLLLVAAASHGADQKKRGEDPSQAVKLMEVILSSVHPQEEFGGNISAVADVLIETLALTQSDETGSAVGELHDIVNRSSFFSGIAKRLEPGQPIQAQVDLIFDFIVNGGFREIKAQKDSATPYTSIFINQARFLWGLFPRPSAVPAPTPNEEEATVRLRGMRMGGGA